MPTSFPDIFYVMDPANPPPVGTDLTAFTLTVTDEDDNDVIAWFGDDSIQGIDITNTWPGDTVTIELADGTQITYVGVTFYLSNGQAVFTPTDGQTLQDGEFVDASFVTTNGTVTPEDLEEIPCFTPGILIETESDLVPVEKLNVGDRVLTQDNGLQPIRWIGKRRVAGIGPLAPIRICAGALGNHRDMLVSPQHRMLLTGWRAELHFGEQELLVAAKHLENADTIHVAPRRDVEYIHLLFDRHEIIFAEGVPTESFHPGAYILERDDAAKAEVLEIFPELAAASAPTWPTARKVLKGSEAPLIRAIAA